MEAYSDERKIIKWDENLNKEANKQNLYQHFSSNHFIGNGKYVYQLPSIEKEQMNFNERFRQFGLEV